MGAGHKRHALHAFVRQLRLLPYRAANAKFARAV